MGACFFLLCKMWLFFGKGISCVFVVFSSPLLIFFFPFDSRLGRGVASI